MYTTIGTYYFFLHDSLLSCRTKRQPLKRIISTNYCVHTAVPPDDGPGYARNMYRLTKYTKL